MRSNFLIVMKNKMFLKAGLVIVVLLLICLFVALPITKRRENASEFYNVLYHCGDTNIEYYDVTELYYDKVGVYFKTQDGATVILNGGAIEIIPLDLD